MKNLVVNLGVVAAGGWILLNSFGQYTTMRAAWKVNADYAKKIETLQAENERLFRLIEIASSSAYLDWQAREKLGLGTEDDYWLELPTEEEIAESPGRTFETKKKEVWQEW